MNPPTLILTRFRHESNATLGRVELGGPVFKIFATLEPLPPVIPTGEWPIRFEYSPKFKRHLWELKNVPGHTELKIHNGNNWAATEGCILIGMRHGNLNGDPAVLSSRLALGQFHDALRPWEGQTLTLEVIDGIGD